MNPRIRSRYTREAQAEKNKTKGAYLERAQVIEKQLIQLLVEVVDNDNLEERQAMVLLRHSLRKLQLALRFMR